jgi:preprotein translocase subunit SecG
MWLSSLIPILLTILVIVCVLLILVVLMQRPRSEGLGAAFGSGMTENIFGAQTTTVLTKATAYLGGIFFAVTLLLTILIARQSAERRVGLLENELTKPAPNATTAPKPPGVVTPGAHPLVSPKSPTGSQATGGTTPSSTAGPSPFVTPNATPAPTSTPLQTSSPTPSH